MFLNPIPCMGLFYVFELFYFFNLQLFYIFILTLILQCKALN